MNYLRHIQRGVEYIEAHLTEDVTLEAVARYARVSLWHYQRIFKALTGDTLKSYIRARRLAHALDALLEPDSRILPIALAAGFESQAAFTRAFKDAFGMTPAQYRSTRQRFKYVRKARIDEAYIEHMQRHASLTPELRTIHATTLVGMRSVFFGVDSDKCNLGAKLPALWAAFLPRMNEVPHGVSGAAYGVVVPSDAHEALTYYACVAVARRSPPPREMVATVVPAATYAIFEHRGLPKDLQHTVNYIYASWLLRSGMRHTYGPDLEIYEADDVPDSPRSVIRYGIPVKRA